MVTVLGGARCSIVGRLDKIIVWGYKLEFSCVAVVWVMDSACRFVEIKINVVLSVGLNEYLGSGASAFVLLPVGSQWGGCAYLIVDK